ncbi:MAG: hypothetical protein WB816_00825 [Methylocystis sp.]
MFDEPLLECFDFERFSAIRAVSPALEVFTSAGGGMPGRGDGSFSFVLFTKIQKKPSETF